MLFRQAARYGDRTLFHYRDGDGPWREYSWSDSLRSVVAVASALIDAGVKPGDSVLLLSENRLEWLYCDFGIQAAGAVTVPIYPNVTEEMAQTIAEDSAAVYAIASDERLAGK
ncbi:MAG TPA: AMP-binding protein, partial [Candidatus Udaeobacter sp.]|nr:AMP-binding protein [Candidatus Udaeobacter sp.]